jgi:hypothetical protein
MRAVRRRLGSSLTERMFQMVCAKPANWFRQRYEYVVARCEIYPDDIRRSNGLSEDPDRNGTDEADREIRGEHAQPVQSHGTSPLASGFAGLPSVADRLAVNKTAMLNDYRK